MKLFELLDVIHPTQSLTIMSKSSVYSGSRLHIPEKLEHKEIKYIWSNPIQNKIMIEVEE